MTRRTGVLLALGVVLAAAALLEGVGRLTGRGLGFGRSDGCAVRRLGDTRVSAECRWDVPSEWVHGLIREWGEHHRHFVNLAVSEVLAEAGGVTTVRQIHQAKGMSDREVVIDCTIEPMGDGVRYAWVKSGDQSALSGAGVEVEDYAGFWEVTGGHESTTLRYEVLYLPGGDIPLFLLRMFQADGIRDMLGELRAAVESTRLARTP